MAKTVYSCATTLDGFIADPNDGIDWLEGYEGTFDGEGARPLEGGYDSFYERIGALVMGSVTYEFVLREASAWPYSGKPSWILTTRELPKMAGAEEDIRFSSASVRELYSELVAAAGQRDVWVVGGGNIASQFADAGLLDEVTLAVVPVVLGAGKPLFDRGLPGGKMQLLAAHPLDNGMIHVSYAVGG
ncbi:MAG TPA: dihydrofolate reductase family protein [Thermoleophilaceae bacterium]|jgi:dihydrofolate reductase